MRYAGTLVTILIVLFWVSMNSLLVRREIETRELDSFHRGVSAFLGNELQRRRWMSIYRRDGARLEKVGYTSLLLEKLHEEDGLQYAAGIETHFRGSLPGERLFLKKTAKSVSMEINGRLVLDGDMKPLNLQLDLELHLLRGTPVASTHEIYLSGGRKDDGFKVVLLQGDRRLEVTLPLEALALSDGIAPSLPIAGYRVGDSYRVRVFNPLSPLGLGADTATVRVVGMRTERIGGPLVDVYELETDWRGTKTTAWVTRDGELVRQELGPPFDLVLEREDSLYDAQRGFQP